MIVVVNNITWEIIFVNPNNVNLLNDYGEYTLGMTDNNVKCIFLSNELHGEMLYKVLCHELVHTYSFSYDVDLTREDEERLAQFISDYGKSIILNTEYLLHSMR